MHLLSNYTPISVIYALFISPLSVRREEGDAWHARRRRWYWYGTGEAALLQSDTCQPAAIHALIAICSSSPDAYRCPSASHSTSAASAAAKCRQSLRPTRKPAPFAAVLPRHVKAARHAQRAAPRRAQPPRTPAHAQLRQRRAPLARLGGHVRDERARVVRALRHVIKRVELCAAPLAAAAAAAARRGGRVADNDQAVAQFSMSLL